MTQTATVSTQLQNLRVWHDQVVDAVSHPNKTIGAWLKARNLTVSDLAIFSRDLTVATTLAGSMIMAQPTEAVVTEALAPENSQPPATDTLLASITQEEQQAIVDKLKSIVQMPAGHLAREDELYLEQQLTDVLGFEVTAELEGHRLNHSIGIMGGEQHLKRFPTDTLEQQNSVPEAGMAPNRGAFGWFTDNGALTEQAIQREKYYFAVQTMYLPDWNSNHAELKPWYKFRKMIVINPADKIAVVGVVGDAGPAMWVQKQFGGSPEVIREGKIWSKQARGHVLLWFVDDPEDKIPLGVIDLGQKLDVATNALISQADQ